MPIWKAPAVSVQPKVVIEKWSVMETDTGTRHLVGIDRSARKGRVSSAIKQIETEAKLVLTRSGRVYQLAGPAGYDSEAAYTWALWSSRTGVQSSRDVTAEYTASDPGV